jgi:hypothetical protein
LAGAVPSASISSPPIRKPSPKDHLLPADQPSRQNPTLHRQYLRPAHLDEYGFKQAKDELGWADYRLTDAAAIERWWEVVMCAYTLVSLQSPDLVQTETTTDQAPTTPVETHPQWDHGQGWKPQLNNLRLLLQPFICTCLLLPWLHLLPLPHLQAGLTELSALMNTVRSLVPT